MGSFQDLRVWQRAKNLAVYIYKLTSEGGFQKDFGLRDQIRRATVSISSNIAEGYSLDTNRQAIKFFYIARGSAAESLTQAIIAFEISYISRESFQYLESEFKAIGAMLTKLIQARSNLQPNTFNLTPET